MRILASLAVLLGGTTLAHAAVDTTKIQPFDCNQVGGPPPAYYANEFTGKPASKVTLICPFNASMNKYLVRFYDGDGRGGAASLKVYITQTKFFDYSTLNRETSGQMCAFKSNQYYGPSNAAVVPCAITITGRSYQAFVIELRNRGTPDIPIVFSTFISKMVAWWTRRSTAASVMAWSGKTFAQSPKGWLAVISRERRS